MRTSDVVRNLLLPVALLHALMVVLAWGHASEQLQQTIGTVGLFALCGLAGYRARVLGGTRKQGHAAAFWIAVSTLSPRVSRSR